MDGKTQARQHVPDILLERYLADDLVPEERRRIQDACASSPALRERLDRLARERLAFLQADPPSRFAHRVVTELSLAAESAPRPRRRWAWLLAPSVAAAATVMLAVTFSQVTDTAPPASLTEKIERSAADRAPAAAPPAEAAHEAEWSMAAGEERGGAPEPAGEALAAPLAKAGQDPRADAPSLLSAEDGRAAAQKPPRARAELETRGASPRRSREARRSPAPAPAKPAPRGATGARGTLADDGSQSLISLGAGSAASGASPLAEPAAPPPRQDKKAPAAAAHPASAPPAPGDRDRGSAAEEAPAQQRAEAAAEARAPEADTDQPGPPDRPDRPAAEARAKKSAPALRNCLTAASAAGEIAAGSYTLVLAWTIEPNGKVIEAKLEGPAALASTSVRACVLGELRRWEFPASRLGLSLRVAVGPLAAK